MSAADPRPERMYRSGRPIDSLFEPQEMLYRMFRPDAAEADRLVSILVPFDVSMSVNRGKHSQPYDILFVLYPKYIDWGVAQFRVEDVPNRLESEGGPVFEWQVEHVPEEDNYAHSEVRMYKNGIHSKVIEPPKLIKKRFRVLLSDRLKLVVCRIKGPYLNRSLSDLRGPV